MRDLLNVMMNMEDDIYFGESIINSAKYGGLNRKNGIFLKLYDLISL